MVTGVEKEGTENRDPPGPLKCSDGQRYRIGNEEMGVYFYEFLPLRESRRRSDRRHSRTSDGVLIMVQ